VTEATTTRAIIVERTLPYPAEKIWRVLTDPVLIARWLMPNDFAPIAGHVFNFRTKPMGGWDGIVDCEVLEIEPCRLLRYSWEGGAKTNPNYGSRLVSTVTWTLTAVDGGTRVRMVHDGFGPANDAAYDAMHPGWARVLGRIEEIAAALE
jgi:uncharacterized protein YndB with AHSA1/START domain